MVNLAQNQFREIFSKPVMIVGLSISHASPGSDMPSIVSAAFSCDSAAAKYCCIRKTQAKGLGIIADMENIMVEGLKAFYGRTKVIFGFGAIEDLYSYSGQTCKDRCLPTRRI